MDKIRKLALAVLMASPFLAACMPDSPDTQLTWDANTRMSKSQARAHYAAPRIAANGNTARTYVYQDQYAVTPTPRPSPTSTAYSPISSQPLAPIGNAPNFAWPVSGRVVADFGTTTNGGKNDGINIATALGAPIHASASGTVTYAGDELKNYGNLVLVKHASGFTTAYAHADRLVVQKGDPVTRGQIIGYSGQTGDVTSPQLHFEIRSNTTPVNPRSYLSNTTASAGY